MCYERDGWIIDQYFSCGCGWSGISRRRGRMALPLSARCQLGAASIMGVVAQKLAKCAREVRGTRLTSTSTEALTPRVLIDESEPGHRRLALMARVGCQGPVSAAGCHLRGVTRRPSAQGMTNTGSSPGFGRHGVRRAGLPGSEACCTKLGSQCRLYLRGGRDMARSTWTLCSSGPQKPIPMAPNLRRPCAEMALSRDHS